jgi:hypothetical protein
MVPVIVVVALPGSVMMLPPCGTVNESALSVLPKVVVALLLVMMMFAKALVPVIVPVAV